MSIPVTADLLEEIAKYRKKSSEDHGHNTYSAMQVAAEEVADTIELALSEPGSRLYALWVSGTGEGCDYTLGCNVAVHVFPASSLDEALAEVRQLWEDGGRGDISWKDARLLTYVDYIGEEKMPELNELVERWSSEGEMPKDPGAAQALTRKTLASSPVFSAYIESLGLSAVDIAMSDPIDMSRWTQAVHLHARAWAKGDEKHPTTQVVAHFTKLKRAS